MLFKKSILFQRALVKSMEKTKEYVKWPFKSGGEFAWVEIRLRIIQEPLCKRRSQSHWLLPISCEGGFRSSSRFHFLFFGTAISACGSVLAGFAFSYCIRKKWIISDGRRTNVTSINQYHALSKRPFLPLLWLQVKYAARGRSGRHEENKQKEAIFSIWEWMKK